VSALLSNLFPWSAWAQQATVLAGTKMRALQWPLFARSAWAPQVTVVVGTKNEGAALAYVCSVGVGSASL
jgi:hypothetical protein